MEIWGKALKYGNNINTDVIIPGEFLSISDPKELAKQGHAQNNAVPPEEGYGLNSNTGSHEYKCHSCQCPC